MTFCDWLSPQGTWLEVVLTTLSQDSKIDSELKNVEALLQMIY